MCRQGVPVGDEIKTLVFWLPIRKAGLLEPQPVREGAKIVTEVQRPGRTHTTEHSFAFCHERIMSKKMEKRKRKIVCHETQRTQRKAFTTETQRPQGNQTLGEP